MEMDIVSKIYPSAIENQISTKKECFNSAVKRFIIETVQAGSKKESLETFEYEKIEEL